MSRGCTSTPSHYQDAGDWRRISNRLERDGGSWANAANRYELTIPESLGDGPLELAHDGRSLSFRLQGAADVSAEITGGDATFRGVMPGVTARWSAQNDSVKEELVLRRANVPRTYHYDVVGSAGLSVRSQPDGGLEFVDAAGKSVFVVPAAFAYDGKGFEAPPGTVALSARAAKSGWKIALTVDDEWSSPGFVDI